MATTVYDIKLRYLVEDRAARGVKSLGNELNKASKSSSMLADSLKRAAAGAIGFFGIRAMKRGLVDFNASMEQARVQMAGMIQLNTGGDWNDNMKKSTELVGALQQRAKASVGTTKDFVDMASMLARPVTAAGLGMKELEDFTTGAVISAKAFGVEAEVAARDIEQAFMGTLGRKDRFAFALLAPQLKAANMELADFNALSDKQRTEFITGALNSKTIQDMAKAQEGTFDGVLSTFQDNLQMLLGKIGLPLFQALTAEIQNWNAWLDKNQASVRQFAADFSSALKTGFTVVRDVLGFLFQNRETLITLAKGFLALGAMKFVNNKMGAFGELLQGLKMSGKGLNSFGAGLTGFSNKLGGILQGAAAAFGAFQLGTFLSKKVFGDEMEDEQKRMNFLKTDEGQRAQFAKMAAFGQTDETRQNAAMFLKASQLMNTVDIPTLQRVVSGAKATGMSIEERIANDKMLDKLRKTMAGDVAGGSLRGLSAGFNQLADKPKINVNINKIEVESNDPDRFVFGLTETLSDAVKNPNSAFNTFREG